MTERLTKSDWIAHGLRMLTRFGPSALKAGPLAAGLKVSRGSFYWHFADIADYHAQLVAEWQASGTDQVITSVEEVGGPDRLRSLLRRAFLAPSKLDRAVRAWATIDRKVAAAVAANDDRRIAYIANLLKASGVERPRAYARATFLYWAFLGQAVTQTRETLSPAMLDDISRLFER